MGPAMDYVQKRLRYLRNRPDLLAPPPMDPRDPSYDLGAMVRYMSMQGRKSRMLQAMNRRKGGGVQ